MSYSNDLTPEELRAYLLRSEIPAIIVEGKDDMSVYRWIDNNRNDMLGLVLPCGGKANLLELAKNQKDFAHIPVVFLGDSDNACVIGENESIQNLFWTEGYSIENDLLDTNVPFELMTELERKKFEKVIESLSDWFSYCLVHQAEGEEVEIGAHSRKIIDHSSGSLRVSCDIDSKYILQYSALIAKIKKEPIKYIRGKNLFDSILVFLSDKKRPSKYSRQNLFEMCSVYHERSTILKDRLEQIFAVIAPEESSRSDSE